MKQGGRKDDMFSRATLCVCFKKVCSYRISCEHEIDVALKNRHQDLPLPRRTFCEEGHGFGTTGQFATDLTAKIGALFAAM